jgi:hypothetical protein
MPAGPPATSATSVHPKLHRTLANGVTLASFEWRAALCGAAPDPVILSPADYHPKNSSCRLAKARRASAGKA